MPISIQEYHQSLEWLGDGRKHILLGNGFSVGCDSIFSYSSLFDAAVSLGLSAKAQEVFRRLGTNNFEGVMSTLNQSHWISVLYQLIQDGDSPMLEDAEIVKRTLVQAVANSHLAHSALVSDDKKASALRFLKTYHNIFTTNYDLLTYWVNMFEQPPNWKDGFRADEEDPNRPHLVFSERLGGQKGLFYLHGALHLYVVYGELRKHSWIRTGRHLTELIQEKLSDNEFPLFVAEGVADAKLAQIQGSGYLWYCLDKFARIQERLVVYGHSLGPSDSHLSDLIVRNTSLGKVAIGLHGDIQSEGNQAIRRTMESLKDRRNQVLLRRPKGSELEVQYFQSESAVVWDTVAA